MAGPTYKARMGKKHRAKPGDLAACTAALWRGISATLAYLDEAEGAQVLAATHALAQACTAYSKLLSVGEVEARLAALEANMALMEVQREHEF